MDGDIDVYKHFSWLKRSQVNHHSAASNETYQERLARLEGDKESLILQVSVLTDQVEAQGEKIRDLEVCLEGHQVKLNAAEEMLQQELLSRTSLETQKLDLMTEVSELKLKLVGMEKEQKEQEEKQRKAEVSVTQHVGWGLRWGPGLYVLGSKPSSQLQSQQPLGTKEYSCTKGTMICLIPSYQVLLLLHISAMPKPLSFGFSALSSNC